MFRLIIVCALSQSSDVITIDRDNIEITQSCRIQIAADRIVDADNNGVVHIMRDGLTVDFADQSLHGAPAQLLPNEFTGTGIKITAKNVTLHNANVSGYKVGIHAINADGLTIHHCDVSNNFHQRLKSTPKAEDGGDWLWPHHNDNNQWITNYGTGLCVEDSNNVTIRNIRARKGQNGIILDRVNDSKVYDCDCSFLSGWGLAMWRSNRNVISRNAFDFCVRGYSHGVYNRGQDSAGILMFEQCCENIIAENSVTHGGDGFFGFAGKEALGENGGMGVTPVHDLAWHKRRGCNANIISGNDFSFAVAHGLEMTFSFDNKIQNNRFWNNAICGIWGGYSQDMVIQSNSFSGNGGMGYGAERGGVAIEHGSRNLIGDNKFFNNPCAIRLWWDDDRSILELPWAKANEARSMDNRVLFNHFNNNRIALELEQSTQTALHLNKGALHHKSNGIAADEISLNSLIFDALAQLHPIAAVAGITGTSRPVFLEDAKPPRSSRGRLAGRENIIMTEWGPWDHQLPLLQFVQNFHHTHEYKLLGAKTIPSADGISIEGEVFAEVRDGLIRVIPRQQNSLAPYRIAFTIDGHALSAAGTLTGGTWTVKTFASTLDPRRDAEPWRDAGLAAGHELTIDQLDLRFGHGGMTELRGLAVRLPSDHFGTIATRTLTFPAGRWRVKTLSDDGIRVWLDDDLVIDDWTHHAPKEHTHEFTIDKPREINLRVEHFELDGYAVLSLEIEPID